MDKKETMYGLKAEKLEVLKKKYKIQVAPYREMDANFFKVCRGIFILKDSKAIHLYLYLCSCYNYKTGRVFPSYDTIRNSTGLDRNTISSKLKVLQKLKLVKVMKRKTGTGFNNTYAINYITSIVEKSRISESLEVEEILDIASNFEESIPDIDIDEDIYSVDDFEDMPDS